MTGWVGSVNGYATKWFGVGGEISAVFGDLTPSGAPGFHGKEYSYLFGPQFRFASASKTQVGFRWLIGGAFAQVNLPGSITAEQVQAAAAAGYTGFNQTKFAMLLAVPVDIAINKTVALRVEPGLYVTDFNQTKQSNLRFSVGPVFRFGER